MTVTDTHNCSYDTTISIFSPPKIITHLITTNVPCSKYCNAMAEISSSGGKPPYLYNWSNDSTGLQVINLCAGNYSVTITDSNLCKIVDNFIIKDSSLFPAISIKPDPDSIHPGRSAVIYIAPQKDSYTYKWSPSSGLDNVNNPDPKANPGKTTEYYLTITDSLGCTFQDSVKIIVYEVICDYPYIFVPNAFTPEANVNSVLYVKSTIVTSLHFAIYDRWGQKVFEATDMNTGWNGTFNGKKCIPGVFDYYIEATCLDNKTYKGKGNITLIR